MALFQDPMFLSEAKVSGISLDPMSGEYIGKLVRELRALPPAVIAAARAAAGGLEAWAPGNGSLE
jgi:hypothetical protein